MKTYDVVGICNALVDILIKVEEDDIKTLGLTKGVMHLVDAPRQIEVLAHFHSPAKPGPTSVPEAKAGRPAVDRRVG